jgi:hypothetical protein
MVSGIIDLTCSYRYGPPGRTSSTFSLLEWSRQPKVEEAWKALTQDNGLVLDPFSEEKRTQIFGISDSAVIGDWPLSLSMRKARKLGFLGTADSYESAFKTIHDLARLKLVASPVMKDFVE